MPHGYKSRIHHPVVYTHTSINYMLKHEYVYVLHTHTSTKSHKSTQHKNGFLTHFLRLAIINLLTLYGILITIIFILYNFLKFLISKLLILIYILYLLPSVFYRHTLIWYIKSFLVNFFTPYSPLYFTTKIYL